MIGVVTLGDDNIISSFQYTSDFVKKGIEIAPLTIPLRLKPYRFPDLSHGTFHGLPGLLAESLSDKFGTILIDTWLSSKGQSPCDLMPFSAYVTLETAVQERSNFHLLPVLR
jgi:serine/threonine-protein kinase HipA